MVKRIRTKIVWTTEGGEIETYHEDGHVTGADRDLNVRIARYTEAIYNHRAIARSKSKWGEPSPMFVSHYVESGAGELGEPLVDWKQTPVPYLFMKLLVEKLG